jgi:hypothetical protein
LRFWVKINSLDRTSSINKDWFVSVPAEMGLTHEPRPLIRQNHVIIHSGNGDTHDVLPDPRL